MARCGALSAARRPAGGRVNFGKNYVEHCRRNWACLPNSCRLVMASLDAQVTQLTQIHSAGGAPRIRASKKTP